MNTSKAPKVSVVMPVYNAQRTLKSAIQSVLNQSFSDLELILVNDGSTDESLTRINEVKDSRIRLLSFKQNSGTAHAQNAGFSMTRGEFIALHDADDLWDTRKLEIHLAELAKTNADISLSHSRFIDSEGLAIRAGQFPKGRNFSPAEILLHYPIGNGSNAVFRRSLLDRVSKIDGGWVTEKMGPCHDVEMWVRFALSARPSFVCIPQTLTYYRISSSSYSANISLKMNSFEQLLLMIGSYAPELIRDFGRSGRAFHLRYLARRALFGGDAKMSLELLRQALSASPKIFFQSPIRFLATLVAALALLPMPQKLRIGLLQRVLKRRSKVTRT